MAETSTSNESKALPGWAFRMWKSALRSGPLATRSGLS
ncbi:hypothetical protein [Achromobacter phage kwar_LB4]|nr:hypothetical protein [Achromobacter phage kwar_LB4]